MVFLVLGDSQVERIWPTVRLDREVLRDALFVPVKNRQSIMAGFQAITASVSINCIDGYDTILFYKSSLGFDESYFNFTT